MDENKLIADAQSGDKKALAEVVKNYEQTIYNFAFKICRDRDKAEQIMQETFYSMIKSLHQFDGKSKLSTWLYRIVTNHCLMLARKLKSRQFVSIDDDDFLFFDELHFGQVTSCWFADDLCRISNLLLHSVHLYSKTGIFCSY